MRSPFIIILTLLALSIAAPPAWAQDRAPRNFIALAYHNVEDSDPDQAFVGVTTEKLIAHLSWLQGNGYRPVTVDDLLAARTGSKALPDKAVLLTFDDGYASFYTRVLPILKAFRFPAVLALVGTWMEGGPGTTVSYASDKGLTAPPGHGSVQFGDRKVGRDVFLTWDQVREIVGSGLVEIASHSHGAHHGTQANPQQNYEPDVTTKSFDPATGRYESDASERRDLESDSARMALKIERETGKRPRVMVWPYGEHNELAISIAAANGMPITLTLIDGAATLDKLSAVPRHLVNPDPGLGEFVAELRSFTEAAPVRAVHVDLDDVYDADPARQASNLDRLVQRIYNMQISTVILHAFADSRSAGLAREVYFPNRLLPMRADLLNRVSWQLRTRSRVQVFAWMPVLAFDFGDHQALRLDAETRRKVLMLYEDLARQAPFDGLLFNDEGLLSDVVAAGVPRSITATTDALRAFTVELTAQARVYRAPLLTAGGIRAPPSLDVGGAERFAETLDRHLGAYDYVVITAMRNLPEHDAEGDLRRLVAIAAARPHGLKRTIFELQFVDQRQMAGEKELDIPTEILRRQMRLLLRLGALNFGYHPGDFIAGPPIERRLHQDFSLQSYPFLK